MIGSHTGNEDGKEELLCGESEETGNPASKSKWGTRVLPRENNLPSETISRRINFDSGRMKVRWYD